MNRTTLITISDVELGKKDIYDDFKDEQTLINFINSISENKQKTILILNGDSFDFLKMPYQNYFTHLITEDISVWKMQQILESYPKIFEALSNFLKNPHNYLHFNIGNHDYDLVWLSLQKLIKEKLSQDGKIDSTKITFDHQFNFSKVHIEHGQLYDFFYKYNPQKTTIKKRGKHYLNLPLGHTAIIKFFVELKSKFPKEEKIFPRVAAYELNPEFKKARDKISKRFIWKGLFFDPIINPIDPISQLPITNLIKHIYHFGVDAENDHKFIHTRLNLMQKNNPDKEVLIMGHSHIETFKKPQEKSWQLVTDTWREEFLIDHENQLVEKDKTYAQIELEGNEILEVKLNKFTN